MLSSAIAGAVFSKLHQQESYPSHGSEVWITAAGNRDDYYDENGNEENVRRQPKRYSPREQSFSTLGGLLKNQKQLGAGLLGIGGLLTVMGTMLFFEGTLLRLGNVSRYHMFSNQQFNLR